MTYKNYYAIGDVQGCYNVLQRLLTTINFNPKQDQLWFVGDIVNRGSQSLDTLRFIKSLGNSAKMVLGNHDLFLLTAYYGYIVPDSKETIGEVLAANDCEQLIMWLQQQPLLYYDQQYVMTHAGIPPQWTLAEAQHYAHQVETALQHDTENFLQSLFGNQPDTWSNDLTGYDKLRYITNAFTRMRFCSPEGKLDLSYSAGIEQYQGEGLPWFAIPERKTKHNKILFGHWAALRAKVDANNVFALDTGCGWGEQLTAMRLSDQVLFSVSA